MKDVKYIVTCGSMPFDGDDFEIESVKPFTTPVEVSDYLARQYNDTFDGIPTSLGLRKKSQKTYIKKVEQMKPGKSFKVTAPSILPAKIVWRVDMIG